MSGVVLERNGGVARVTIDRPESLNAISRDADQHLNRIWVDLEADPELRVVVLTGAGDRAFCVGADFADDDEFPEMTDLEYWAEARPNGFGGIALRETLDVPVIARVNGYALGGGLEMMLGCDMVVASSNAQFGLPETRIGRQPLDGGMVLLPRRIAWVHAMEMLLTGRRISATEALEWGLVNRVVEPEGLDSAVEEFVAQVLACGPASIRAVKQFVRRTSGMDPAHALNAGVPALFDAFASGESNEGVAAFSEKRRPTWAPEEPKKD